MKISQVAVFMLAALAAATQNCTPAAIEGSRSPSTTTVTITITSTLTSTARMTQSPEAENTITNLDDMTIAVTNLLGNDVSLSFGSDAGGPSPVGDPLPTTLDDNGFTQYTFPTGWAGRICVGPNLNPNGSKIEGSYTGPPDIDISYVDGYSVPITCSSENIPVSGCNIDLFNQPGIPCNNLVEGSVCLNPAKKVAPDGPALPFFAACEGAAYTYPSDNEANAGDLKSTLVSCCIGTSCSAPLRQPKQSNSTKRMYIRGTKPRTLEKGHQSISP